MTATTTTIAAFRQALVDMIATVVTVNQVDYGAPAVQQGECVYLGATVPSTHEQRALKADRRRRTEDYTTLVRVEISSQVDYPQSEERCVEVAAAIESAIAADYLIGGSVEGLLWVVVREITMSSSIGGHGNPQTTIEMILDAKAHLQ